MDTTPVVQTTPSPETVSASHAAVIADDPQAYREAKRAERAGKPLAAVTLDKPTEKPVEAKSDAASAETPPKPLSSKERHRLAENERIRQAVEEGVQARLTAEREKWAQEHPNRVEAPKSVERPAPAAAPAGPPKTFDEAIQRPDVSKPLMPEDEFFKAFPEAPYSAYSRYAAQYDRLALAQSDQRRTEQESLRSAQKAEIDTFVGQLQAEAKADPTFQSSLTETVKTKLKPFAALQRDAQGNQIEQAGPINVIGEQVYASPIAPKMLRYFSEHPDALDRLITVPTHLASLPPALRTQRHITWQMQEYGKLEATVGAQLSAAANTTPEAPKIKTVTDAPAPTKLLGTKSAEPGDRKTSAIRAGQSGVQAYRDLRRQERAAAMGRR